MTIRLVDGSEFLHIPKTGGTWVESVLRENGLVASRYGHEHADFDRNLFQSAFYARDHLKAAASMVRSRLSGSDASQSDEKSVFRFCFVRNPLSWYESWWKFMNGQDWHQWGTVNSRSRWHPNAILNGLGSEDFNTFVRNVIRTRPGYVSELMFAYTKPGMTLIGRTECLRRDLARVLDRLGLPYDAALLEQKPDMLVSAPPRQELRWDTELRRTVMLLELPALIHFGYLSAAQMAELGIVEPLEPNPALMRCEN